MITNIKCGVKLSSNFDETYEDVVEGCEGFLEHLRDSLKNVRIHTLMRVI